MRREEIIEAEVIHREDALRRIAAMIARYNLTPAEILALFPEGKRAAAAGRDAPKSKPFDPFFDV